MYAVRCKKHNCLYIGQTGDQLNNRMSKYRWDAKNRPDNNELATHFHKHDIDNDMEVWILQTGLKTEAERLYHEDRWICLLQTMPETGLNEKINHYAKAMYDCYRVTT